MFEDTLLIIKSDYLNKRKFLLKYLLQKCFQIQGNRRLRFTPEMAADFYNYIGDGALFMVQVIMLSKGNSEAFILAKEDAVKDLIDTLVCYFGTSQEMERHVHVTPCEEKVQREITFIFPNYIHEPIYCVDQLQFCTQNTVIGPLIAEMYNMLKMPDEEPEKSWKRKIAEFLLRDNTNMPQVSNICNRCLAKDLVEVAQQTLVTGMPQKRDPLRSFRKGLKITQSFQSQDLSVDSAHSSANVTSSSCITCSVFSSRDNLMTQQHTYPKKPIGEVIKEKAAPLSKPYVVPECVPPEDDLLDDNLPDDNLQGIIDVGEEEEDIGEEYIDVEAEKDLPSSVKPSLVSQRLTQQARETKASTKPSVVTQPKDSVAPDTTEAPSEMERGSEPPKESEPEAVAGEAAQQEAPAEESAPRETATEQPAATEPEAEAEAQPIVEEPASAVDESAPNQEASVEIEAVSEGDAVVTDNAEPIVEQPAE